MIFQENEFLKTYDNMNKLWEAVETLATEVEINGKTYEFETPFLDYFTFIQRFRGQRRSGIYIKRHALGKDLGYKYYVGKSVDLFHRVQTHYRAPANDSKYLHNAIISHGKDAFETAIIEYAEVDNLDAREIFWISELNTLNSAFGYNLKTGGEGGASSYIVSQEMHDAIIADLQHSELTEVDIAKKFGLKSAKTVYTINQGCHWLSSSKYQYPIRDTALIKSIGQAATRLKDLRTPWVRLYRMADSKHQNIEEDEFLGRFLGAGKAAHEVYRIFRAENELGDLSETKILSNIQRGLNRRDRHWFEFYIIPE